MIQERILEAQGVIEWTPVHALAIDKEYQRTLAPYKVKDICAHFDKNAVGTLAVSLRDDGLFYIMDGQHRYAAMQKLGIEYARCEVFRGLSQAQEADIFLRRNAATKKPEALDLFRARLIKQDPVALAVRNIVEKCGLAIQFHPLGGKPTRKRPAKMIWAVQALEDIYKRDNGVLLEEVLLLAMQSWPDDGDAFQSKVLLGLADFRLKYKGKYLREDFIAKMQTKDIKSLLRRAYYHSEIGGGSMPKTFSKALQEHYDSGRRSRRLLKEKG